MTPPHIRSTSPLEHRSNPEAPDATVEGPLPLGSEKASPPVTEPKNQEQTADDEEGANSWRRVMWFELPLSLVLEAGVGPKRFGIDSEKNNRQVGVHVQPALVLRDGLAGRRPDSGVYRLPKIFNLGVDLAAALSFPGQGSRALSLDEVEAAHGDYIDSIDPVEGGTRTLISGQRLSTSSWIFSGAVYAGFLWRLGGAGRVWLGPQMQGGVQGSEVYLSDEAHLHSKNPEAPAVGSLGPVELHVSEADIHLEKTSTTKQVRGFLGAGLQLRAGNLAGSMLLNVGCRVLIHPNGIEPMLTVGIGGNMGFGHRRRD